MGPRTCLDGCEKSHPAPEFDPGTFHSVDSCYTVYPMLSRPRRCLLNDDNDDDDDDDDVDVDDYDNNNNNNNNTRSC